MEDDSDFWKERLKIDTLRLSQFLLSAGQVRRICLIFSWHRLKFAVLWFTVCQTT